MIKSKEKTTEINMILLAAGNSRRFGSNKLLTDFNGKPLYIHTVEMVLAIQQELQSLNLTREDAWGEQGLGGSKGNGIEVYCNIIMVSQYEEILKLASTLGWRTVENKEPEKGISNSIRLGLSMTASKSQKEKSGKQGICKKYMFFVCDQPLLKAKNVVGLIEAYLKSEKSMACLAHKEQLGNPCIFDESYLEQLAKLEGDIGGKKIIMKEIKKTLKVEIACEKELWDVDSIQDFIRLKNY